MFLISDILAYLILVGQCKITFWQRSPACVLYMCTSWKAQILRKETKQKPKKRLVPENQRIHDKAFNILHIKGVKYFMHFKYFDTPHL